MDGKLKLYRGDSIKNTFTNPGNCRSEGIRSAAFGAGGDPRNIELKTPLMAIKEHIDHLTKSEIAYYNITDFISFTENEETAKLWAADREPEKLEECAVPYFETRYVFQCQIERSQMIPMAIGIWEYQYQCNPNLKASSGSDSPLLTSILRAKACPLCQSSSKKHSLILLKPSLFLNHLNEERKFKRAINLAIKNDEWLLLPNDLDGHGLRTTRIQPSNFWHFKSYFKTDEPVRTKDSYFLM